MIWPSSSVVNALFNCPIKTSSFPLMYKYISVPPLRPATYSSPAACSKDRGVAGFLWLGVQTIEAPQAGTTTAGYPHKFSHRICTNLRGPPDRPWGPDPRTPKGVAGRGVPDPRIPRPATPLSKEMRRLSRILRELLQQLDAAERVLC
jgi:hypothetical protein